MKPLILASQSPRRIQILNMFNLPFEQAEHGFDERTIPWNGDAHEYTQKIAVEKGRNVAQRFPDRIIISADTIVVLNETILTKPKNKDIAFNMMKSLSGKWNSVVTGIAVLQSGLVHSATDKTRVYIQPLTDEQIHTYLLLEEWQDKAGGYAIQGHGSLLVEQIEGCYYNVIGLPVILLSKLLKHVGIDLWHFVI